MAIETYKIDVSANGMRIDVALQTLSGKTRSHFSHLIDEGRVFINSTPVTKSGTKVKLNDEITIDYPALIEKIEKKDIPIDILYQDKYIAVINKPQGLTVHPAPGNYDETLVNGLMFYLDSLSGINGEIRPGIVHRLDKDTSGVMVVAKNDEAHVALSAQIENRTVKKVYVALVEGNLKEDEGEIKTGIARSKRDRKAMAVDPNGKEAITRYKVLARYKNNCLVAFRILTGRTHQIRVHAKHLQHPIVGDETYGYKKQRFDLDGQMLHAYLLEFNHPKTGKLASFSAPLPETFFKILKIVQNESNMQNCGDDIQKDIVDIIDNACKML